MTNTAENDSLFKIKRPNWVRFSIFWVIAALVTFLIARILQTGTLQRYWVFTYSWDAFFSEIVYWPYSIISRLPESVYWFVPIPTVWILSDYLGKLEWPIRLIPSYSITGLITGITQWVVIRRYIRDAYWWVLATAFGYALAATFFMAGIVDFDWLLENQVFISVFESLFGNHPAYNSSLVATPSYDYVNEITMRLLMAVVIGFFQWVLFLRWFERTGYWVLITVVGLAAVFYLYMLPGWLVYAIITGTGLSYLLKMKWDEEMRTERQPNPTLS